MKKNPYQFTIRFKQHDRRTLPGSGILKPLWYACEGTCDRGKHWICTCVRKSNCWDLGELERIEVVPEMNGQEQREDKRQEKKADQKAIPKPEPVVYAPEVEALNEEDLDAIAASLGAWDMED